MKKFNLLGTAEKLVRDVSLRSGINKSDNIKLAKQFGFEYFDGSRDQGYGGYHYDGRWVPVAKKIIGRYELSAGSRFLDVGCAKGFLLKDISDINPKIELYGLDVSSYAIKHAPEEIKPFIRQGNCKQLPFPNDYFDAVVAINTIHNLPYKECIRSIKELIRVTKNKENIFLQVDAYTDERELDLFKQWVLTAETYLPIHGWIELFEKCNYKGDYFWTIIGFEQ